jgi:hypothetical protein
MWSLSLLFVGEWLTDRRRVGANDRCDVISTETQDLPRGMHYIVPNYSFVSWLSYMNSNVYFLVDAFIKRGNYACALIATTVSM